MPTPKQIQMIQIAARKVGLRTNTDDTRYRMLLRNVAGVDSCKALTNDTFEDVMAVMEDMGFADRGESGEGGGDDRYWRGRVERRGAFIHSRTVFVIRELAADSRYELIALVGRFTKGRTASVELMRPHEGWALIEMLKASNQREKQNA